MRRVYCIDTSALVAAWQERYPPENFPRLWTRFEELIDDGRLVAPIEVRREIARRSDELHNWLKARPRMFRELEENIQIAAADVLRAHPRLVGEKKLRTSADPFVIALARVDALQIVTEEKFTNSMNRPNIPDVCLALDMPQCFDLLKLIKTEGWVLG
jgi:hypothetical protein